MSSMAWSSWLDRLENARNSEQSLSSKIRSGKMNNLGTSVFALQQSVSRLRREFDDMVTKMGSSGVHAVTPQEMRRREENLTQLELNQKSLLAAYNQRANPKQGQSTLEAGSQMLRMQNQMMQDQDDQLQFISKGVSNLKQYSLAVKDESELHVKLLIDIHNDVERATVGLEAEGGRAEKVAKRSSNCRLYIAIVILLVILLFLLIVGGSK